MNRRQFVGAAVAAGAVQAQDRKLKLGVIGCGWYGGVDMRAAYNAGGVEFIGLCDVDSKMLEDTAAAVEKQEGVKPRTFKHYKDLLAMQGLDGVIIATPPHWHALMAVAACEAGKDIYLQKPMTMYPAESLVVRAAVKKHQRVNSRLLRRCLLVEGMGALIKALDPVSLLIRTDLS